MSAGRRAARGLAFRCSASGLVLEIVRDDLQTGLAPGLRLAEWVSPTCAKDALRLLAHLCEHSAAFGWRLEIPCAGSYRTLHVAATPLGDSRILTAAETPAGAAALYGQILQEARKEAHQEEPAGAALGATDPQGTSLTLIEDYARINNELVALRRELERRNAELRRSNEHLESSVAERTRALQTSNAHLLELTTSMAHDLAIPVRGIHAFAGMLAESHGTQLDAEGLSLLERLQQAALRLAAQMDGLRRIDRVSRASVHLCCVDVTALAEEIWAAQRVLYSDSRTSFAAAPGMVLNTDRTLLEDALRELLDNALKFSAPKATAEVCVRLEHEDGDPVLVVADTGVGIDPRYAHKLFRPFERLHRPGEFSGEGIGLAVVRRVADQLEATVSIDGAPDKGVTTRLRFPKTASLPSPPHGAR